MSSEVVAGLFVLAGALSGGLVGYAATRADRRWETAKQKIAQLCDQVKAYHKLEELYTGEVARLDPAGRRARTIMDEVRTRVAEMQGFKRPTMTANQADALREEWV